MPVFDYRCGACKTIEEHFVWSADVLMPCSKCGGQAEKLFSNFNIPFSGSIRKYTILGRENDQMDGFYAYKKVSSVSGQPEQVWIGSMQELKEFNKAEGLAAPGEVPSNATVSADGRRLLSNGLPGQWQGGIPELPSRLKEMVNVPAEECGPMPATACPAMPEDYRVRVEAVQAPAEVGG